MKEVKERLEGYRCFFNDARREKKKGRAKGGIVVAIKKCERIKEVEFEKVNEECTKVGVQIDNKDWLIVVVVERNKKTDMGLSKKRNREYSRKAPISWWRF